MIKPGVYILSHDVKNPKPDRRQRYDWRTKATWPKGSVFTIEADSSMNDRLRIYETWSRWTHLNSYYLDNTPHIETLLAALEPAPKTGELTLKQALRAHHYEDAQAFEALSRLIDMQVVSDEQLEQALLSLDAEYEAKEM